jgi:hypothetical protein
MSEATMQLETLGTGGRRGEEGGGASGGRRQAGEEGGRREEGGELGAVRVAAGARLSACEVASLGR